MHYAKFVAYRNLATNKIEAAQDIYFSDQIATLQMQLDEQHPRLYLI